MPSSSPRRERPVRPVDAASLVIVRGHGRDAEVLMGKRRSASSFMPGWYVFPGGRVDRADAAAALGAALREDVAARLMRRTGPAGAVALAMAAIRETYEETGLLMARSATPGAPAPAAGAAAPLARACASAGAVPALAALDYIARAITPTSSPKRFNARFFLIDAAHARGRLGGSGELIDLRWVPIGARSDLPIADVTEFVLDRAVRALSGRADPARRTPVLCYVNGTSRILHE